MRKQLKSNIEMEMSLKNFKLNKKRTISTIIGIILSVSLICAVATMATSFQETLIQNAINETGYYHLKIDNVPSVEKEQIEQIKNVSKVQELSEIGYGKLDGCQNESKPYVHLYSMSEEVFNSLKFDLVEGNFPQNNEEILVSKHIKTNGGVNLQIGDTIALDIGQRTISENEILNQFNPYIENEEQISNPKKYNFKIVGIIERPEYSFENYGDPGYTIISTNIKNDLSNLYITLENPHKYKETIPEILGANDFSDVRNSNTESFIFEEYSLNKELLSIFIFITMNAFITNAFDLTGNYYKDYDYNMVLYNGVENLSQEQLNKIFQLNNIKEKYLLYDAEQYSLTITDLSKINTIDERNYGENEEVFGYMMQIVALDDNSFKKYAKEIGAKYDEIKEKGILYDEITNWDEETGNAKKSRRYNYEENDTITGLYGEKEIKVQVGAVTADEPYGLEGTYSGGGYLIFNKDYYKDLTFKLSQININSNNAEKLQEEIESLKLNISINNMEANVKEEKAMILVIKIFLYGFIAVITLIGVTNIFNTITSNMELRQKEFAMLKSIGMTKKEFNRMINLETLFYGTKSLIYGIILGLIGTYAMYEAFAVKIDAGVYIPIKPIILSIIFVFILIFIIMRYSISKINKQNIIETIRKENV